MLVHVWVRVGDRERSNLTCNFQVSVLQYNFTDIQEGKSTPKIPQLVIELQNRPPTAKPDTGHPSTNKTIHFRSFGGFDPGFIQRGG
jgi:hypothetical protein